MNVKQGKKINLLCILLNTIKIKWCYNLFSLHLHLMKIYLTITLYGAVTVPASLLAVNQGSEPLQHTQVDSLYLFIHSTWAAAQDSKHHKLKLILLQVIYQL